MANIIFNKAFHGQMYGLTVIGPDPVPSLGGASEARVLSLRQGYFEGEKAQGEPLKEGLPLILEDSPKAVKKESEAK